MNRREVIIGTAALASICLAGAASAEPALPSNFGEWASHLENVLKVRSLSTVETEALAEYLKPGLFNFAGEKNSGALYGVSVQSDGAVVMTDVKGLLKYELVSSSQSRDGQLGVFTMSIGEAHKDCEPVRALSETFSHPGGIGEYWVFPTKTQLGITQPRAALIVYETADRRCLTWVNSEWAREEMRAVKGALID